MLVKGGKEMRFTKKMLLALAFMCFVFAFTPAGEALGTNSVEDVQAAAPTHSLNKSTLTLRPAYGYNLNVVGYEGNVLWYTSDKSVAVVTPEGRVISKKPGTATIKARDENKVLLGMCTVTVAYGNKTYKGYTYKDIKGRSYGFTGRWYSFSNSTFTNANGSTFYFRVSGTDKVKLNFVYNTTNSSKTTPMYAYSINGGAFKRKAVTSNVIELGGTGVYYVKVVIDAIATVEKRYEGVGVGIASVVPYDTKYGYVSGIIPLDNRIAFYGDSITEGVASVASSYYPSGCSATHSYAWYTADGLNAIPIICGYASTGVKVTGKEESIGKIEFTNASTAIRRFTKTIAVDGYDQRTKVVVLEYGTNDTCTSSEFQSLYTSLIKQVRTAYPNALIVCMTPFYQQKYATQIKNAVNQSGVSNVRVFDTTGISISGYKDSLHPSDSVAKRNIAPRLISFIKQYSSDF